jgi:steroid 5-alpha reductase family enzyme
LSAPLALAAGAALAFLLMTVAFALARRLDNYSVVDVAWSANFTPLAWLYAASGPGEPSRRLAVALLVTLWSLRLALHLAARIAAQHPREDGRYETLRRQWAPRLAARFFVFFQLQGLLNVALSLPFLIATRDLRPLGALEAAAAALFAIALAGESLADAQLRAWKARPETRERTCREGLWRYSRHPNYFFEWLAWCAFALFATASPWGPAAWASPALMLFFLLRVTGLPATEAQAVRSKGDDYRAYQRTTSAFVPWFPRV